MIQKGLSAKLILSMIIITILIVPTASVSAKKHQQSDSIDEYPISKKIIRFEETIPLNIPPEYGYPIPAGAYYKVNVYGINVGKGVILIDSGDEDQAKQLYQSVMKAFNKPVIAVYLTHGHADHAGGGSYFQDKGIPVYSSIYEAPIIEAGANNPYYPLPDVFTYTPYTPDYSYEYADEAHGFTVMDTSGHTPGSVSIEYRQGHTEYLFTGDTIFETPSEDQLDFSFTLSWNTAYQLWQLDPSSITTWMNSVSYLESLVQGIDTVCPGHGGVYSGTEALWYLGFTTQILGILPYPPS